MNGIEMDKAGAMTTVQRPVIIRERQPGMAVTRIVFPTHQELHLSLLPISGEEPLAMVSRLVGQLRAKGAVVVRHEIFGSLAIYAETMSALRDEVEVLDWPVTWVEGKTTATRTICGMHIYAVIGKRVETIYRKAQPVARIFSDGSFKHCVFGGIVSSNQKASRPAQYHDVFERLVDILSESGMNMTNVVRTWFFLDDILGWYGEFNQVRNEFYHRHNVYDGLVPASTGIGGRNPTGSALVIGAWAVQPENELATVREVVSPLQCSATDYGSSFSRAVLMDGGGLQRLLISGTASIKPGGQSAHDGDLDKQIEMSMEVTGAILKSCGFNFNDVTRATGYFKARHNAASFKWSIGQRQQFVITEADICRPELLFEIELDAVFVS